MTLALIKFFTNTHYFEETLSLDQIERCAFRNYATLYFEYPEKKSLDLFKSVIRYQLSEITYEEIYGINQLGFSNFNGKHFFCFGNHTLGNDIQHIQVASELDEFKLQYDKLDDQKFYESICAFTGFLPKVSLPMMAYLTLALSRQLFVDAGIPIKFTLYIVGSSQSFKTTLASLYFNIYNRHDDVEAHVFNFNSTEAKLLQVLDKMKDSPIVFDDLNKSDLSTTMHRQEQRIAALIHSAANNIGKQTLHSSYTVNGQPVFCGEYTLQNISTNNRTILLKFSADMFDKEKLKLLQDNADAIPQFAEEFVSWILTDYDLRVKEIANLHQQYLLSRANRKIYQPRLEESCNVMRIAFELFLSFAKYKKWDKLTDYSNSFTHFMRENIREQIEEQQLDGGNAPDYCLELFRAVSNYYQEKYPSKKPGKDRFPDCYYNMDAELLYITGEFASELILERLNKKVSPYVIFSSLFLMGFLKTDKNKSGSRTKKVGDCSRRYYCIRYSLWTEYLRETYYNEDNDQFDIEY